jgi:hypothetical protein
MFAVPTIPECIGLAAVVIGEFMISSKRASKRSWRFWAFSWYLVYDVAFFYYAWRIGSLSIMSMQVFFLYITIRGMWNNRRVR